jgi:hypothetical protein
VGELIGQIVAGILSIAVGFALGSVVFFLVRGGRWALLRSERGTTIADPRGGSWSVRIPLAPSPMRLWVSKRMLRMRAGDRRNREASGASPDGVVASELVHPRTLVDKTDEAASIVAVALLVFVLFALVMLVLEAILVALVAAIVAVVRLTWGRWQCEIIAPDGRRASVNAGSLSDARARASEVRDSISQRGTFDEAPSEARPE